MKSSIDRDQTKNTTQVINSNGWLIVGIPKCATATPAMYEGITNYIARAMYDQGYDRGHNDNQGGGNQGYSKHGFKTSKQGGILMPTN